MVPLIHNFYNCGAWTAVAYILGVGHSSQHHEWGGVVYTQSSLVCSCRIDGTSVFAHCTNVVFFSTCLNAKATIWVFCHLADVSVLCPSSLATASHLTMQYSRSKWFLCLALLGLPFLSVCTSKHPSIRQRNHREHGSVLVWLLALTCAFCVILLTLLYSMFALTGRIIWLRSVSWWWRLAQDTRRTASRSSDDFCGDQWCPGWPSCVVTSVS